MRATRRLVLPSISVLALGLVAGCGQFSFDFSRDDPSGYTACRDLTASRQIDDDGERRDLLDTAAAAAASAQSGEIRATVDPPVDPEKQEFVGHEDIGTYTVDEDALDEACAGLGFEPDDVDVAGS